MVNKVKIIPSKTTAESIGLHLEGRSEQGVDINTGYPLYQLRISELQIEGATIILPNNENTGNFRFTPASHADDPAGKPGSVNYKLIADLLRHDLHDHDAPPPTRAPTQDRLDLNAQASTLAFLLGRINNPYKTLSLDITTDADGFITHHEFVCVNADGSETIWAPNPHVIGLIQKPNEKPCASLQWFDSINDLVAEVRCEVGTNQLAGFRKILANGAAKTRSYSAEQAETFLHESEAADAQAESGG